MKSRLKKLKHVHEHTEDITYTRVSQHFKMVAELCDKGKLCTISKAKNYNLHPCPFPEDDGDE